MMFILIPLERKGSFFHFISVSNPFYKYPGFSLEAKWVGFTIKMPCLSLFYPPPPKKKSYRGEKHHQVFSAYREVHTSAQRITRKKADGISPTDGTERHWMLGAWRGIRIMGNSTVWRKVSIAFWQQSYFSRLSFIGYLLFSFCRGVFPHFTLDWA